VFERDGKAYKEGGTREEMLEDNAKWREKVETQRVSVKRRGEGR
jgi:hypothetical protein